MKKTLTITLALALVVALVSGCAANPPRSTVAPTLRPTEVPVIPDVPEVPENDLVPSPGFDEPLVSPESGAIPDVSPDVANPDVSPEINPDVTPEVSPDVSPGASPDAEASPTPSVSPANTGASANTEAPSSMASLVDASEIAAVAAQQQNVQRAIAIQYDHTCLIGVTLRSGKKYNQAVEDAVIAAARKKNDSIAYFVTADAGEVQTLNTILDTWDQSEKNEKNKSDFERLSKLLKDAAEAKSKQS